MIERALIFPAWLVFRALSLALWYPTVGTLKVTAWLAEGYRAAGGANDA